MLLQMFVVLFVAFVLVRRWLRVERREEGWNTRNRRCENDTILTYRENTYLADRFTNRQKSGIVLSRTAKQTDLEPIWSVFVRKSDSKSAPKSAPKYLDRTGLRPFAATRCKSHGVKKIVVGVAKIDRFPPKSSRSHTVYRPNGLFFFTPPV